MTTIKIANFIPVTESDADPAGELNWSDTMRYRLAEQWETAVTKAFHENGETTASVSGWIGEVIADIDGAWNTWTESTWDAIYDMVGDFEVDFEALTAGLED